MPRNVHLSLVKGRKRKGKENEKPAEQKVMVFKEKRYSKIVKFLKAKYKDTKIHSAFNFIKKKFDDFVAYCIGDADVSFKDVKVHYVSPGYYIRTVIKHYAKMVWLFTKGVLKLIMPVVIPLCGILIVCFSLWALSTHTIALKVTVGEEMLGYVTSESEFNSINNRVVDEVLQKTGESYTMEELPSMELSVIKNMDLTAEEEIYSTLSQMADDYMGKTYGLFIDGTLIATSRDEGDFVELKERLVSYYITGAEGEKWEILNDFEVVRDSYDKKYLSSYADVWAMFTTPEVSKKHTVVLEDEWETLSKDYGVSVAVLKMMNPQIKRLTVGDVIEVGEPKYQISVKTTRTVSYTEKIPYQTVYINNSSIYEGNTSIKSYGSNGSYSITAEITVVDGEEISRDILRKVQTSSPVNREVWVGTKTISPSGNFIFPVARSGYQFKSSSFGWRTLYGRPNFHRGVDLAARYGTPIYAADAGTVISYGWDPYGSLGYQIKIDHGNGIVSVYGHCSRLSSNVYLGKKVYQGETIAYVGSTGNSTGNHLHFGLYYKSSGNYFDAWPYIS